MMEVEGASGVKRQPTGGVEVAVSVPQRRMLGVLRDGLITGRGRGMSAREVAEGMWPDSEAWNKRTRGRTGNRNGAMGGTMPMNAAKMLHKLVALHLAWRDDEDHFWLTETGRRKLQEG